MNEITVQELKALMDNKEEFQLIDVREDFEYDASNIGGTHIPLGTLLDEVGQLSRDKPLIIQCRSGKRSAQAVTILQKREGFDNVYNLKGGILAWRDELDPELFVY